MFLKFAHALTSFLLTPHHPFFATSTQMSAQVVQEEKKVITYEDLQAHKGKDDLYVLIHGKSAYSYWGFRVNAC